MDLQDMEGIIPERFVTMKLNDGPVVLQTRDLLNWYASYVVGRRNQRPGFARNWYSMTREIYYPKVLRKYKVIPVVFDEFVVSRRYRRNICEEIGGDYNETVLRDVHHGGGGSSFDKQTYHGQGDKMKVLERYKQVPPEYFERLFREETHIYKFYREITADPEKLEFIDALNI